MIPSLQTLAELQSSFTPASVQTLSCLSCATSGDLLGNQMTFKRVATNPGSSSFTGTIANNTLTVSGVTGTIAIGQIVAGAGVTPTVITAGAGLSWTVNFTQAVGPVAMTGSTGLPYIRSSDTFLPNGSIDATNGGYWILTNNIIMPEMFGAVRNGVTDDSGAIQAAINYAESATITPTPAGHKVSPIAIMFTIGTYACSNGLVSRVGVRYFAPTVTMGGDQGTSTVRILFPNTFTGVAGWHFTDNNSGLCTVENISLQFGSATGTPAPIHGWMIDFTIRMFNCGALFWPGNGFHVNGQAGFGVAAGFADSCMFTVCLASGCGYNGFYGWGSNYQIGLFNTCYAFGNYQFGFRDQGLLGNVYLNCNSAANANASVTATPPLVTFGGATYMVVPINNFANSDFALTLPSTTTPGTDSTVWQLISNSALPGVPAWSSGTLYQPGGPFCTSAACSVYRPYCESTQPYSWVLGVVLDPEDFGFNAPSIAAPVKFIDGGLSVTQTNQVGALQNIVTTLGNIGATRTTGNLNFWEVSGSVSGQFIMSFDATSNVLLCARSSVLGGWNISSNAVGTPQYGTGAGISGQFGCISIGLGYNNSIPANGMVLGASSSAPASGARGLGWFNFAWGGGVTVAGLLGWQTTTAGSPGTQTPLYGSHVPAYGASTVALLPTGVQGASATVTDSTQTLAAGIGTAAVGGGVNITPVYHDGTTWRIG